MATIIDAGIATGIEQLRKDIIDFSQGDESMIGRFQAKQVAEASRWGYRWAYKKWSGGVFRKTDLDGGVYGAGTGPKHNYLTAGFYNAELVFAITQEQIERSKSSAVNFTNVMAEILSNVKTASRQYFNAHCHSDGTGVLTGGCSAAASGVMTFNSASDNKRNLRLTNGFTYDVWNSGLSTNRGSIQIDWNDIAAGTVKVVGGSLPSGTTTGDVIALHDADAYGPTTLQAGATSTWPGGGLTNGPGFTGDTWIHGLEYANKIDPATYFLGKLRSTYPELVPAYYDGSAANGGILDWSTVELLKNRLILQRDKMITDGLRGCLSLAQTHQLKDSMVTVQTWQRQMSQTAPSGMPDVAPNLEYDQDFNLGGIPAASSKMAQLDRLDLFNVKNWGMIGSDQGLADFLRSPSGELQFMPAIDPTTGRQKAAWEFRTLFSLDTVCHDPGAGAYADGFTVKSEYKPT